MNSERNQGDVVIKCVHGVKQTYPTVEMWVVVQEQPYLVKVAVEFSKSSDFNSF